MTEQNETYYADLLAYLEGKLDSGEARELEERLEDSAEMQESLEWLRALADSARERQTPAPEPGSLAGGVAARIEKLKALGLDEELPAEQWLDAAGFPELRQELDMRAAVDAPFNDELDAVRRIAGRLERMGNAFARRLPAYNMAQDVRAAAAACPEAGADQEPRLDVAADCIDGWTPADGCAASDLGAYDEARLRRLVNDLDRMGSAYAQRLPAVDLHGAVHGAISGPAEPRGEARRLSFSRAALGTLAAAAAVAIAFGAWLTFGPERPVSQELAYERTVEQAPAPPAETPKEELVETRLAEAEKVLDRQAPVAPRRDPQDFEVTGDPDLTALSPSDLVRASNQAPNGEAAWRQIVEWGALSPEEALEVLEQPDASAGAVVGAAAALSPEEREVYLLQAVGQLSRQHGARWALARTYYQHPDRLTEAQLALSELAELDPDNALPYYLQAKLLLEQGRVEPAIALLKQAARLPLARTYSMESAQYHEEALLAKGVEPETARMITALSAGSEQYEFLCDLGNDLLEYGRSLIENGEEHQAETVFQSVQRLSEQLNEGVSFVQESWAALDIETAVLNMLAAYNMESIELLTIQTLELLDSLTNVGEWVQAVESFLSSASSVDVWLSLADQIMSEGSAADFDLFALMEQGAPPAAASMD
jgi:tetratricopeptide (TPR) repeat protein